MTSPESIGPEALGDVDYLLAADESVARLPDTRCSDPGGVVAGAALPPDCKARSRDPADEPADEPRTNDQEGLTASWRSGP